VSARWTIALALACVAGCASEPPAVIPGGGPLCASGRYWTRGDHGDNFMHPGRACIQCHTERARGPVFSVAGTLFNARHEENECFGNAGDAVTGRRTWVEVVDQSNRPFIIEPNPSGNFYTTHEFRFPLKRIRVITPSGHVAQMDDPPSGDCNTCHTREGIEGAPGRVIAPNQGH
jgi:hypothetical protein